MCRWRGGASDKGGGEGGEPHQHQTTVLLLLFAAGVPTAPYSYFLCRVCHLCNMPCVMLQQIVEQTKEIQGTTQAALADQREQMHRIEDDMDRVRCWA